MKLYIMKRDALETLKANLPELYGRYYTESSNKWIWDVCGDNPFVEYKDISDFKLASLNSDLTPGEIDLNNCKILYENLQFLSESQASDERLWAGLTHTTFYDYMRRRWGYGYGKKPKSAEKEAGVIKTRFFYSSNGRSGFYRNTLAKCWWVGRNTYNPNNVKNHFEGLDIIGSNDLNSKVTEFFFNFTFSSNPEVLFAIIDSLKQFKENGQQLLVRDHIRPALSYLNAVGGSVVIDCLDRETITEIFSDAINAILQGDAPELHMDNPPPVSEDDVDDGLSTSAETDSDRAEVAMGCKIVVRNRSNQKKTFVYDFHLGSFPPFLEVFTGHKEGDEIQMLNDIWTIESIAF